MTRFKAQTLSTSAAWTEETHSGGSADSVEIQEEGIGGKRSGEFPRGAPNTAAEMSVRDRSENGMKAEEVEAILVEQAFTIGRMPHSDSS